MKHWLEIEKYEATGRLGPRDRQFVTVWFHGCDRNCPGCVAADWNQKREVDLRVTPELFAWMLTEEHDPDGLVLSGGEPFRQAAGIAAFLEKADSILGRRLDLMVYTGYRYEELMQMAQENAGVRALLERTDILIDGEYIAALDDGLLIRGSSNQRVLFLTDRYTASDLPMEGRREVSLSVSGGEMSLTGIPSGEAKTVWCILKKKFGT
ncbi:MAG: radical SAM protein [Oscillospiraceae bacterium]|nr:radical SAM protein [Oscillospiraceae bacterium]